MNHLAQTGVASHRQQRGAVLAIALIMLTSLTLISTGAVQTALMELKMALNSEEMANAFQTAQAAIDFALSDTDHLPMTGELNTPTTVSVSGSPFVLASGETLAASAERTIDCGAPPRLGTGSSLLSYSTFSFRVSADLDRSANGRGRSSIRQGYLVLGPKC